MLGKVSSYLPLLGGKFWDEKYVFLSPERKMNYQYCMCKLSPPHLLTIDIYFTHILPHTHIHAHG